MKRPIIDEFVQAEGSIYATNTQTGKEIVFFQSETSNLVIRSMMEEDLPFVSKKRNYTRKEEKNLLRQLKAENSEYQFFVLTEPMLEDDKGDMPIIGTATFRVDEDKKITDDIDVMLYLSKDLTPQVLELAKVVLVNRVINLMLKFSEKVNGNGMITINRVA